LGRLSCKKAEGEGEMEKIKEVFLIIREKYKPIAAASAVIVFIWLAVYIFSLPDGKLRVVFCDVGQGDGIYIDLPDGRDILIDGGPDRKILQCLGKHMPFWDRSIDMVFLTHSEADHLNGLVHVLERYKVDYFISSPAGNETKEFKKLIELVKDKKISVRNVYADDVVRLRNDIVFRVLWPSRKFVAQKVERGGERENVLGAKTEHEDLNDFSLVMELVFEDFEILFTGDADEEIQDDILAVSNVEQVEVFKIPHHGSKYGILDAYLKAAEPRFGVISVGKNRWGHPREEILDKLQNEGVEVYRTDKQGSVLFISDGKQIWVKSDK